MTPPLFLLPFDHRASLARDVLGVSFPLSVAQRQELALLKQVVFEGFLSARARYRGHGVLGILVDPEFGLPLAKKALTLSIPLALTLEQSGGRVFSFDRPDWRSLLTTLRPAFAKALVRYTVGDEKTNVVSRRRLAQLSAFCKREQISLLLEVLVEEEMGKGKGESIGTMMDEMHQGGVWPAMWKIEGLPTSAAWKRVATHAKTPMIVLGRGASQATVDGWLTKAAKSHAVHGFAVGRTIFLRALQDYQHGTIDRATAIARIAKNFTHCIQTWERAS